MRALTHDEIEGDCSLVFFALPVKQTRPSTPQAVFYTFRSLFLCVCVCATRAAWSLYRVRQRQGRFHNLQRPRQPDEDHGLHANGNGADRTEPEHQHEPWVRSIQHKYTYFPLHQGSLPCWSLIACGIRFLEQYAWLFIRLLRVKVSYCKVPPRLIDRFAGDASAPLLSLGTLGFICISLFLVSKVPCKNETCICFVQSVGRVVQFTSVTSETAWWSQFKEWRSAGPSIHSGFAWTQWSTWEEIIEACYEVVVKIKIFNLWSPVL